jgi:hypothetical protein
METAWVGRETVYPLAHPSARAAREPVSAGPGPGRARTRPSWRPTHPPRCGPPDRPGLAATESRRARIPRQRLIALPLAAPGPKKARPNQALEHVFRRHFPIGSGPKAPAICEALFGTSKSAKLRVGVPAAAESTRRCRCAAAGAARWSGPSRRRSRRGRTATGGGGLGRLRPRSPSPISAGSR